MKYAPGLAADVETPGMRLVSDSPQQRVLRHLRKCIVEGVIPSGEVLPSERKLSEQLGVGRNTVRKVLEALSEEGLLKNQTGRRRQAIGRATRAAAGDWMKQAVVVLMPALDLRGAKDRQTHWLDYLTLGSVKELRNRGLHTLSLVADGLSHQEFERLAADRPFGCVVPEVFSEGSRTFELVEAISRHHVPVAVYGGHPELAGFDRVTSDHEAGAFELTRYLISRGAKRIVSLLPGSVNGYWFPKRRAGYEAAMRQAGLEPLPTLEIPPVPNFDVLGHAANARQLFDSSVRYTAGHLIDQFTGTTQTDAFLLSSDRDYYVAAAACRLFGRTPGKDILICGYDNYYAECVEQEYEPTVPTATIDKLNHQMGRELVQLLLDRVGGKLPSQPQQRVVTPKLVVCGDDTMRDRTLTQTSIVGG